MKRKTKAKTKSSKPIPQPKSPEGLALAIFAAADKKLPAGKRRFKKRKDVLVTLIF